MACVCYILDPIRNLTVARTVSTVIAGFPGLFTVWGIGAEKLLNCDNLSYPGVPGCWSGRRIDVCIKNYGYLQAHAGQKKGNEEVVSLAKWSNRERAQIRPGIFIKPVKYYQFYYPEMAGLVPRQAQKILHTGCGRGDLGAVLKNVDKQREVVGIEVDQMSAQVALNKLDHVITGNVEHINLDFSTVYFDCIIISGVLEHLINPWDTLVYLKKFLHPAGCLILSVFNVKNFNVINHISK